MMEDVADLIAALEGDATPSAASQVISLATTYFESTRRGEGPVSSGRTPNEIAARFDGPMPEEGPDLATSVARIARDSRAGATRLGRPRSLGHQDFGTVVRKHIAANVLGQCRLFAIFQRIDAQRCSAIAGATVVRRTTNNVKQVSGLR